MGILSARIPIYAIFLASGPCTEGARVGGRSDGSSETSDSTVCLLQFLNRGRTLESVLVQQSRTSIATAGRTRVGPTGPVNAEPKPEPCCGANPSNSSAGRGHCFEAGVDLFTRHEDLLGLFGDNVAMNPHSYKFFLEGDCVTVDGAVKCKYTEITDPDVRGHDFQVGISDVKIKALDISGNSYECIKTLYVYDEEPPVFTTPPEKRAIELIHDVNSETCNISNREPFEAYEALGFSSTAFDNCDKDVTIVKMIFDETGETKLYDSRENDPYDSFAHGPGLYKLVYVAVDDYSDKIAFPQKRENLETKHELTLKLRDAAPPTKISECPQDVNVTIEPNEVETKEGNVTWTVPQVTADNCLHVIPAFEAEELNGLTPGVKFPVGTTRVKYEFEDGSGNAYPDECKFTVTVVQKENPVVLTCPEDITVETLKHAPFALVDWPAPVATQGGDALEVTYPQGVAPGMPFPFGITDVKVEAVGTLPVGQTGDPPSRACFFTVTVRDPEDPMCDGRTLRCAAGSPSGATEPYSICEGPQLAVTSHEDFAATHEYEIRGVTGSPAFTGCCDSEAGMFHSCIAAAPGSLTKYCKPDEVEGGHVTVPTEEPFIEFEHFGGFGGEGTTAAPTVSLTASPTPPPTQVAAEGWGWGSPEPTVEPIIHGEFECSAMADILLVIDGSSSVTAPGFEDAKKFAVALVNHTAPPTRVGVVLYSGPPDDKSTPRYHPVGDSRFWESDLVVADLTADKAEVIASLRGMPYRGGGTRTGAALDRARSMLEANARPGAGKAVLVVTDGEATDWARMETAAQAVRQTGALLHISVMSVPGQSLHETTAAAATYSHVVTPPAKDHLEAEPSYTTMLEKVDAYAHALCPGHR